MIATATAFVDPAQATALAERHIDGPYYAELPWRVRHLRGPVLVAVLEGVRVYCPRVLRKTFFLLC